MRKALVILFLIPHFVVSAQTDVVQKVLSALQESREKFPAMRPQIFFSQDKYAPGDTAYFRLLILTETEKILAERALFNVELVNNRGEIVLRQMAICLPYGAANQLILPANLEPGMYEVRVFSERMTTAYGLVRPLLVVGTQALTEAKSVDTQVSFYPEGGHLVAGVLNRLIVRAEGRPPESASLQSNEGRVTPIQFEHGLASVHFIPLAGQQYHLDYVTLGQLRRAELPAVQRDAITLRVYPGPRKTQVIGVSSGPQAPRSCTLLLIAGRQLVHSQVVRLNDDGSANVIVADGFFPEGFSELFLVNDDLQVLSYRPVYVPPSLQVAASISDLPQSAGLRSDVGFSVRVTDPRGQPLRSSLTVSISSGETRLSPVRTPDPSLELRAAQPTFDWTGSASRIEAELLSGSPIPTRVVPDFPLLLYSGSLNLSGKVFSPDPDDPLPYLSRIVVYLHNDLIQYEAAVDGGGNFHIEKIYDFMGTDKIFYKVIDQRRQTVPARVDWSANLSEEVPYSSGNFEASTLEDHYGMLRNRKKVIDRSFGYFLTMDSVPTMSTNFNDRLERQLGGADIVARPSEYLPFATMQELILEVIPSLKFRVHGKDSLVGVSLDTRDPAFVPMRYAEGNPLYVIDGYMTSNTRYLMSLSPGDIEVVKIINDIGKLDRLQNLARDGVLFIQTRIPERTRRDLEKELHPISGLSPTLSVSTKYPTRKRVPDLRSLLYWTPLTDTDSTGQARITFRTSDLPGVYWVRIIGVTETGHLFTTEQSFEVKFR